MPQPTDPRTLGLSGLAHRCAQETEHFFNRQGYDPAYCYELFRRAIVTGDQHAHEGIYLQYQALVASWVERHPSYASTHEEVQYFVNRAFEKLWRALTPAKFARFEDLKAVLAYFKMCTHSVIIDYARASQHTLVDEEPGQEELTLGRDDSQALEDDAIQKADRAGFWRSIDERLGDEKERAVIYGSFVLAMKPAEVQKQYQHLFTDVKDVYRTKQNVIDRLRRDQNLLTLLGGNA
jgi:DNA-directed RNA polymerase specialized sigma24 family protein